MRFSHSEKVLNIAHRGVRSLAPENTLIAARRAYAIGADMWEMDVNMTADGELVIIHDDTLERTSNVQQVFPDRAPWRVCDFTLDELYRLDFGSWFGLEDPFGRIAAGHVGKVELEMYQGERIPTLQEALELTRNFHWRVNVEIKDLTGTPGDSLVVEKVLALIHELEMNNHVLLSSFNHAYLERSRAIDPGIHLGALVEMPVENPAAMLHNLGAQALNPYFALVSRDMIHDLRSHGYDVFVWTVNDEMDMRMMIDAGVSGIITDYPQFLKRLL